MTSTGHVLIVGAGIAGTTLALFLRKAGIRVSLFEAYPSLQGPGGGFSIASNGMNVLEALGLADATTAAGAPVTEICFRSDRGVELGRFANGRQTASRRPSVALLRTKLHGILAEALAGDGIAVHCSKRLESITDRGADGVVARFEDGSEAHGDLLVGADGVWSKTRELMLPAAPKPVYLGVVGVGGWADLPPASTQALAGEREAMTFAVGNGAQFGYCKFGGGASDWGWWCHLPRTRQETAEPGALASDALRGAVLERYRGWHEPVGAFIRSTPELLATAIHTVPPLPRWSVGRIVLIGDAAHAMSPSSGQGASVSLEDALYLGKLLRDHRGDLPSLLAAYEAERRPRAEAIARTGLQNEARQNQPMSRFGCWLRNRFMAALLPRFGPAMFEKVYRYELSWDQPA